MPGVRGGNLRLAGRFGASAAERMALPLMKRRDLGGEGFGELSEGGWETLLDTLSEAARESGAGPQAQCLLLWPVASSPCGLGGAIRLHRGPSGAKRGHFCAPPQTELKAADHRAG